MCSLETGTQLNVVKLVIADDSEPIENVLKRFKRAVNQSGHLMELRHKELWETAADKRKRKVGERTTLSEREKRPPPTSTHLFSFQSKIYKTNQAERARQLNRIERTNDKYERRNDGASSEYNS